MSDARHNASEAAALDAVLDELLQQVASNAPIEDRVRATSSASAHAADTPRETIGDASAEDDEPQDHEPLIDPPGTDHTPPDANAASLDAQAALIDREVLSDSLDDLLREATELQQTIDAVTPPLSGDAANQGLPEPDAAPPEAESDAEPHTSGPAPSEDPAELPEPASSLDSLDEQLAALTDDLLAGEIESPNQAMDASAPAPSIAPSNDHPGDQLDPDPALAAPGALAPPHAQAHSGRAHATQSPAATGVVGSAPAQPTARGAALAARLRTFLIAHATKLGTLAIRVGAGALLTVLAMLSAPVRQNRTLQQSIGWLALYTLFLACGVWIYLLVFRGPSVPISHAPAPSILNHADSHAPPVPGSHPADHADEHRAPGGGHEGQSGQAPAHRPTPQLVSNQTPVLNRQTYAKSAASQKEAGAKSDGHGSKDAAKDAKGGKEKAKGGGGH